MRWTKGKMKKTMRNDGEIQLGKDQKTYEHQMSSQNRKAAIPEESKGTESKFRLGEGGEACRKIKCPMNVSIGYEWILR